MEFYTPIEKLVDLKTTRYIYSGNLMEALGCDMEELMDIIGENRIPYYYDPEDGKGKVKLNHIDTPINLSYFDEYCFFLKTLVKIADKYPGLNALICSNDPEKCLPEYDFDNLRQRIAELERQLEEVRQENESLKADGSEVVPLVPDCENCSSIQDLEQRIAELTTAKQDFQSHLDAKIAPPNRWKHSCNALFQAFRQVVESSRDDWVKDDFLALAGRLYDNNGDTRGVLDEAGRFAWAALPDRFKAGPGNPKNKGNPTKE